MSLKVSDSSPRSLLVDFLLGICMSWKILSTAYVQPYHEMSLGQENEIESSISGEVCRSNVEVEVRKRLASFK